MRFKDATGLTLEVGSVTWNPKNPFWMSPPSWARMTEAFRREYGPRSKKGDPIIAFERTDEEILRLAKRKP